MHQVRDATGSTPGEKVSECGEPIRPVSLERRPTCWRVAVPSAAVNVRRRGGLEHVVLRMPVKIDEAGHDDPAGVDDLKDRGRRLRTSAMLPPVTTTKPFSNASSGVSTHPRKAKGFPGSARASPSRASRSASRSSAGGAATVPAV